MKGLCSCGVDADNICLTLSSDAKLLALLDRCIINGWMELGGGGGGPGTYDLWPVLLLFAGLAPLLCELPELYLVINVVVDADLLKPGRSRERLRANLFTLFSLMIFFWGASSFCTFFLDGDFDSFFTLDKLSCALASILSTCAAAPLG